MMQQCVFLYVQQRGRLLLQLVLLTVSLLSQENQTSIYRSDRRHLCPEMHAN